MLINKREISIALSEAVWDLELKKKVVKVVA